MEQETRVYVLRITHDDHFHVIRPALEGLLGPDYFSDYSGETAYKIEAFDSVVKGVDGKPFFVHDVKSSYDEDSGDGTDEEGPECLDDIPNGVWKSEELDDLPVLSLSDMEAHPSMANVPWVRGLTEQEREALSDPLDINK